jgi:hypothetical protein
LELGKIILNEREGARFDKVMIAGLVWSKGRSKFNLEGADKDIGI